MKDKMKKETTLSVLKEIRDILKRQNIVKPVIDNTFFEVTFPDKTAQEIVGDNTLGNGKFLWNISWYKDKDFFTKEKCRVGTRLVSTELIGLDKTWNECSDLVREKGGEMLNFAELLFFAQEYYKSTGKYLFNSKWAWTSSKSSVGSLVNVGSFDRDGALVRGSWPVSSRSDVGCPFSVVKTSI